MLNESADDVRLPRTGWLERVQRGWRGCHYCSGSLKAASAPDAIFDEQGMIKRQEKREAACIRMAARVGADPPLLFGPTYDIYNFGVLTGGGLRAFVRGLRDEKIAFGHLYQALLEQRLILYLRSFDRLSR